MFLDVNLELGLFSFSAGSTTDPSFVLPKTASQTTFTPKANLISQTSPQAPSPSTLFSPTSNISFTSESNPACVFTAAQTHATERQMPTALSISDAKQLRDALLGSIVKCTQIQNSLYRLLILKLQAHVTGPSDTGLECSDTSASLLETSGIEKAEECVLNGAQLANIDSKHAKSTRVCLDNITSECGTLNAAGGLDDASKISYVKDTENSEKSVNGAPRTLLGELQDPFNALIRCADIQRELFQRMMTINELNTKEASDLSGKESSPRENKGEKPYSI